MAEPIITDYFTILYVIVTILIAIQISLKYPKYKNTNLLLIGIAWFGMAVPYAPEVIGLMVYFTNAQVNTDVLFFIYVFFNLVIIPFFAFLWLIAFTSLLNVGKTKRLLILNLFLIYSIVYEILIFSCYIIDTALIGTMDGMFLGNWTDIFNVLLFSFIIIMLISGVLFASEALRAESKEIKLKGRLLILAFISFTIGAVIDLMSGSSMIISNIFARSLMITSSFLFYLGYILPDWIKKIFLKE